MTQNRAKTVQNLQTPPATRVVRPVLIQADEAAKWLGITSAALAQMRYLDKGPSYVNIGRSIRYIEDDVIEYIKKYRSETKGN